MCVRPKIRNKHKTKHGECPKKLRKHKVNQKETYEEVKGNM